MYYVGTACMVRPSPIDLLMLGHWMTCRTREPSSARAWEPGGPRQTDASGDDPLSQGAAGCLRRGPTRQDCNQSSVPHIDCRDLFFHHHHHRRRRRRLLHYEVSNLECFVG
ncbi:hypothetical protein BO71DRAFT_114718 [Aspergillus ellipticus CBS 707.79]|uniref:Uncharacterized protein n=1 Tax=Aspergillus ellipticus CBS 707.79 TaxID=1448320 RepID=A0A319DJD4_9EURO|nr:hypothetical protein BO71DRAFT_114718 [Aspergillus ellipticus CBS 707.79]